MAEFYYAKIKAGEMTIEQVPDLWKPAVEALIHQKGQNFKIMEGFKTLHCISKAK